MKRICYFALAAVFLLGCNAIATAAPIKQILFTKKTNLAFPATYTFRFSLWDSADPADPSGKMVWSDDNVVMTLDSAKIVYPLGSNTALDGVDFSQQLWVQVDRWVKSKGAWKAITIARDRLGIVPYALWSEKSSVAVSGGTITGVYGTGGLQGGGTSGDISLSVDFAGTGTAATAARSDHSHEVTGDFVNTTGGAMTGNLVLNTGSAGDLTVSEDGLSKAGGLLTMDVLDAAAASTVEIKNSDASQVANLVVEGAVTASSFTGDGSGLTNIDVSSHVHSGNAITSGTVSEAYIAASIARDGEVTSAVSAHTADASAHHTRYSDAEAVAAMKAADGSGSTLDADLLDGLDSTAFAGTGHTHNFDSNYVNVTGDSMTGDLSTSGIITSTGFRTGDYVINSTGIRTIYTDQSSNINPAINIIPGTADLPGLPGDVNIKGSWAGNYSGGNVTVESGATSGWSTAGLHSKTTLAGGDVSGYANTGSKIQLQGGISAGSGSANVSGGTITITGGVGNGTGAGGNIIILPGSGGTNGNVGIGTTNPTVKLDVNGSINASAALCIAGNCKSSWAGVSPWSTSGSDVYYNIGNVGIGTAVPGAKLDVAGTVKVGVNLGGGDAIYATNSGFGAASNAISAINTGTGHAGNFEINNSGSPNVALVASTSGSGNALRAQTSGGGDTLYSYTSGSGRAGLFQVNNPANAGDALYATTNGNNAAGNAVSGINTGTGHGGNFEIKNSGSPNVALVATTNGSGNALRAQTSGAGDAVYSYTTGSGNAGRFQIINGASSNDALYATTNGSGNAGRFIGNVSVSGTVTATSFSGDGSGLTNVSPAEAVAAVKAADGSGSGLDADMLDGLDSSSFQRKYAKVAVVAQSGGDYSDPYTAMNSYSNWCGAPSSSNRCLLKIMPGVYSVGYNQLDMQNYIDIEGSGENTTAITGGGLYVVRGVSNSEIRFLTVQNTGGSSPAAAIYVESASPRITNVMVISSSGAWTNVGIRGHYGASVTVRNSTISASGGTSSYGYYSNVSTATLLVEHSVIQAGSNTINNASGSTVRVAGSRLEGGNPSNAGTLACIYTYDENFASCDASCVCP